MARKELFTVQVFAVDRIKAEEIVAYARKIGAGRDTHIHAPYPDELLRTSYTPSREKEI